MINFWYTFLVFKKVTSAGLNSLWQKVYRISVKIWIFDELFHKRGTVLVILVPGMIQPSGPGSFLVKKGIWGCRGHWGRRGWWGQGGCRGHRDLKNHYWGLQSHQGSWIQSVEIGSTDLPKSGGAMSPLNPTAPTSLGLHLHPLHSLTPRTPAWFRRPCEQRNRVLHS